MGYQSSKRFHKAGWVISSVARFEQSTLCLVLSETWVFPFELGSFMLIFENPVV